MNKTSSYDWFKFFTFILCFAGIPILLVFYGLRYNSVLNREAYINKLTKNISAFYTELSLFSDQQKFWCYLFNNEIKNKSVASDTIIDTMRNIEANIKDLQKSYKFEYIIYHPEAGGLTNISPDTLGGNGAEQKAALNFCYAYKVFRQWPSVESCEAVLGKVFGPQLYYRHFDFCDADDKEASLVWTDSSYKRKLFWISSVRRCLVITFIDPQDVYNLDCIKTYLRQNAYKIDSDFNFSIREAGKSNFIHFGLDREQKKEIENAFENYEKNRLMQIETDNFYVFPKFLRPGITILGYLNKSVLNQIGIGWGWKISLAVVLVICLLIVVYAWRIFILHILDSLSLKWKLGFLFFFANGLPLLVLMFIGYNFLERERDENIQKIMSSGTSFLQDFDEKYELEFARCLTKKEQIASYVFPLGRTKPLTKADVDAFYYGISSDTWICYLIASKSQVLIDSNEGFFDYSDIKNKTKKISKNAKSQLEFAKTLGQFFLSMANDENLNEKEATEIEIMIESAARKTLGSFIYELLNKRGSFLPLGFGQNVHPAVIDTYSTNGSGKYDYFFIANMRTQKFQKHYLEKAVPQANRNDLGLKLFLWSSDFGFVPEAEQEQNVQTLLQRLTSYPLKEAVTINYKGIECFAMGFECKHLSGCKLVGLYPVEKIDNAIKLRARDLIYIGLLSLLVTFILSWTITKSFISPLTAITQGANAIEQKNFEHRLPQLGRDEFGAMGKIFNDVMVDLEELSVAGAIQEQLLPNSAIKTGNFDLYGKSVAMGALGGDYFDFIEMEDNKFAVLLGDVAGHGVGAALIMAMAKAGIIQLENLRTEPKALVEKLHELIYLSKTKKQKKIMTFQYFYADGNNGTARYSNAGACSPMIIRKNTDTVEELKLSGAALGAFKKGKFSETEVKFDYGDAIVFYTDGIVECKNKNGDMLGYDNLKLLLKNCWDSNAEVYYKNIYKAYLDYIGGDESSAGDDLTIMVLVYNQKLSDETVEIAEIADKENG